MEALRRGKYAYFWVTFLFFLISIVLHWLFGWFAYVDEQESLGAPVLVSSYSIEMFRDTFENWQSEFLQLMWQVAGLAFLLYLGSPQSKEGDERREEKIDALLRFLEPQKGERIIGALDRKYSRK